MWLSDFVNHLYDYRLNWTPLSLITINNKGNTTEWSPTWSVIISVVHKIRQSQRGSLINHECDSFWIGWHKVLLPINQYYDKFEKENKPCLYFFVKKKPTVNSLKCMTAMHAHDAYCPFRQAWHLNCNITLSNYKHDVFTVLLVLKVGWW